MKNDYFERNCCFATSKNLVMSASCRGWYNSRIFEKGIEAIT